MSTFSQFFQSTVPVTAQTPIAGVTLTGQTQVSMAASGGCEVMLSGALTADTYKSLESYSGKGFFTFAGVRSADATARTISIKVILDGVAFEASSSVTNTDLGVILIGGEMGANSQAATPEIIAFNSSFDIQVKSTITETDKVEAIIKYWKVA